MVQSAQADLKQLVLLNGTFGPQEIRILEDAVAGGYAPCSELRDAVYELQSKEEHSPASMVRLGVCLYLLGKYGAAIEALQKGDGGALVLYYLGRANFALKNYGEALGNFQAAAKAGYNNDDCVLREAETLRYADKPEEAIAKLDDLSGAVEQTAEYLYQRGATVSALAGNPDEVVRLYERAVDVDPQHSGALFGLALENDRRGNDEEALDLYKRSASRFPPSLGTLDESRDSL